MHSITEQQQGQLKFKDQIIIYLEFSGCFGGGGFSPFSLGPIIFPLKDPKICNPVFLSL